MSDPYHSPEGDSPPGGDPGSISAAGGEAYGGRPPGQPRPPAPEKTTSGVGCLLWGCLGLVVFCIVGSIVAVFGVRYGVRKMIEPYTTTTPVALPPVQFTEEEYDELVEELETFSDAVEAGENPGRLVLEGDDLNRLLQGSLAGEPEMAWLIEGTRLSIENDQLIGEISWPLGKLSNFFFKGRYLVGRAGFSVVLDAGGDLQVHIVSLENDGRSVPEDVLSALSDINLAEEALNNPQNTDLADALEHFERIEISDGKLIIIGTDVPDEESMIPAQIEPQIEPEIEPEIEIDGEIEVDADDGDGADDDTDDADVLSPAAAESNP